LIKDKSIELRGRARESMEEAIARVEAIATEALARAEEVAVQLIGQKPEGEMSTEPGVAETPAGKIAV